MESVSIESIAQQVGKLADDLRKQIEPVTKEIDELLPSQLCATTSFVYLTGDGDSYHAACAAEMAFESLAGLSCEPISALRFLEYTTPWMSVTSAAPPLVVAISASGKTQRVVQAVEAGRRRGALTIAVTGTPGGPVARAADHSLVIDLARRERSPGICTYQASLLGLVLIAIRLGEARRYRTQSECSALRQELLALPRMIEATVEVIEDRCRSVAAMVADSPLLVMVGSGPNYGTALFSAAKMAEAAGVFAAGQDLEEWCHVESLAYPEDMPVFVIAPPGRSLWRAAELAAIARRQGRRVIAVADAVDTEVATGSFADLPIVGCVREEFSPLLYHVFAGYLASYLAERLHRMPFQTVRPPW